jgi:hypothetical protein
MKTMEAEDVVNHKNLSLFIRSLAGNAFENPSEWQNITVYGYLEALSAFIDSLEGYCRNNRIEFEGEASWSIFAQALEAAKYYE